MARGNIHNLRQRSQAGLQEALDSALEEGGLDGLSLGTVTVRVRERLRQRGWLCRVTCGDHGVAAISGSLSARASL